MRDYLASLAFRGYFAPFTKALDSRRSFIRAFKGSTLLTTSSIKLRDSKAWLLALTHLILVQLILQECHPFLQVLPFHPFLPFPDLIMRMDLAVVKAKAMQPAVKVARAVLSPILLT